MYHLCTTAAFQTIYHKRKILDIRLNIKDFSSVGVTGFEPATTRPPDVYSNRTELRPDSARRSLLASVWDCKYSTFFKKNIFSPDFFYFCKDISPSGTCIQRDPSPIGTSSTLVIRIMGNTRIICRARPKRISDTYL